MHAFGCTNLQCRVSLIGKNCCKRHVLCKDSHVSEIHLKIKIGRCMSGTLTVRQLQTNFPKADKKDIEFSSARCHYATTCLSEG